MDEIYTQQTCRINVIIKIYLLLFITNISSCVRKEPCTSDGVPSVRNIPQETINKVPYKDFAELTFIDSMTQDTHVFYGQGWKESYWYYKDYSEECSDGGNLQKIIQTFYCPTIPKTMDFGMVFTDPGSHYIEVNFTKEIFYLLPGNIPIKNLSEDSIMIRSKWYPNAISFKNQYQPQWKTKYSCIFNKTHGVLKIELPDGTLELFDFKNP